MWLLAKIKNLFKRKEKVLSDSKHLWDTPLESQSRLCKSPKEDWICVKGVKRSIFIHTNPVKKEGDCINLSKTIGMISPIRDESLLIPLCSKLLKQIYEPGYKFYKGGVMLGNLTPDNSQQDLFSIKQKDTLLTNHPYGNLIHYASELGNDRWLPRAEFQSNQFTTRWNEILEV